MALAERQIFLETGAMAAAAVEAMAHLAAAAVLLIIPQAVMEFFPLAAAHF
jgi:UPF0716 family protein affecting phage T7 exclusion